MKKLKKKWENLCPSRKLQKMHFLSVTVSKRAVHKWSRRTTGTCRGASSIPFWRPSFSTNMWIWISCRRPDPLLHTGWRKSEASGCITDCPLFFTSLPIHVCFCLISSVGVFFFLSPFFRLSWSSSQPQSPGCEGPYLSFPIQQPFSLLYSVSAKHWLTAGNVWGKDYNKRGLVPQKCINITRTPRGLSVCVPRRLSATSLTLLICLFLIAERWRWISLFKLLQQSRSPSPAVHQRTSLDVTGLAETCTVSCWMTIINCAVWAARPQEGPVWHCCTIPFSSDGVMESGFVWNSLWEQPLKHFTQRSSLNDLMWTRREMIAIVDMLCHRGRTLSFPLFAFPVVNSTRLGPDFVCLPSDKHHLLGKRTGCEDVDY